MYPQKLFWNEFLCDLLPVTLTCISISYFYMTGVMQKLLKKKWSPVEEVYKDVF